MDDDNEENLKEPQETEDDSFSTEEESEDVQSSAFSDVSSSATDGILRLLAAGEEIPKNARHIWRFSTVEPELSETIPIMGKTFADDGAYWKNMILSGCAATGMSVLPSPAVCRLCLSLENGELETIRLCLLAGSNPNHSCRFNFPLDRAVGKKSLDVAKLLLDAGADVNRSNNCGSTTPLRHATAKKDTDMMLLLLERGAKCDGGDLSCAVRMRFEEGMKILIDTGVNLNEPESDQNALYKAADLSYGNEAELLLKAGANPRISDEEGLTPLHWAARKGGTVVEILLQAGADPNVVHTYMLPPLQCCGTGGITRHCNVFEETPLWLAITYKHLETVKTLLNFGADICLTLPIFGDKSCPIITNLLRSIPSAVTLRTLCLRIIRTHQVDIEGWPPLLFLYPDEAEEYRGYLERTKKFEK